MTPNPNPDSPVVAYEMGPGQSGLARVTDMKNHPLQAVLGELVAMQQ